MVSDAGSALSGGRPRVAIVTCAEIPLLEEDDRLVLPALAALGVDASPAVWDDPAVDWASYDLVVLRSPWDYAQRHAAFLAWAATVPRLVNPVATVAWNTDKRYLAELAAAGLPVTPTTFLAPGDPWTAPATPGEYVIKPAVSAGSRDTGRYGPADAEQALAHVRRLQAAGRITMVQPYLPAVDSYGETALLFFADPDTGRLAYSHAIRKGPMLTGPDEGVETLYKPEEITPRSPTSAERAVGEAVVATLPDGLVYARVDLIPDERGNPLLVELELTEPSVFMLHDEGAATRLAAAIAWAL
ncbi:ATP-grasp domain-containing protein [Catellatospora methionotrophica]|uniref:ATP-grasp domain-containing protein n=1 Tax=Catellatospora methionotrophica TaxID=121620 RepID=UPI0033DDC10B